MSPTAVALILVAAVAHASWNLFSKQASAAGVGSFIWLMSAAAAVLCAPVIAVSVLVEPPRLTGLCWIFLAGTGVLEAGYFLFLQNGYRLGDLSLVYPIGRGTGALLAALAGIAAFGERPGAVAIAGIACLVAGIVLIGIPSRARNRQPQVPSAVSAAMFALITGVFIASYTLWDKYAVTALRTPPLLQGYAAFPIIALLFAPQAHRARDRTARVWQAYRPQVLGAAVLCPLAYILVLAALSFTAVSAVAPAREVSVLFGVLLGRRLLNEGGLARRLMAAAAIVTGIVAIAIG